MHRMAQAGLPVLSDDHLGLPPEGQPRTGGNYYEYDPAKLSSLETGVVKVWPKAAHLLTRKPDGIIYLERRDIHAQAQSIQAQVRLEAVSCPEVLDVDPYLLIEESKAEARGFLSEHRSVPVLRAYTEDLDRDWRGLVSFAADPR